MLCGRSELSWRLSSLRAGWPGYGGSCREPRSMKSFSEDLPRFTVPSPACDAIDSPIGCHKNLFSLPRSCSQHEAGAQPTPHVSDCCFTLSQPYPGKSNGHQQYGWQSSSRPSPRLTALAGDDPPKQLVIRNLLAHPRVSVRPRPASSEFRARSKFGSASTLRHGFAQSARRDTAPDEPSLRCCTRWGPSPPARRPRPAPRSLSRRWL